MQDFFDNIFALADIHGKWQPIRDFYLANKLKYKLDTKKNVMILLGDSGLNYFFNHRDEEVKFRLCKLPFIYFIIRGNHEQRPSVCMDQDRNNWHMEDFWGNQVYVENAYPNIKYALDRPAIYSMPYISGYCEGTKENNYNDEGEPFYKFRKVLTLPGAYSVDKYYRLANGWSWFEQEQMTEAEMNVARCLIKEHKNIDLVLSHTCPIIYEPTDLFISSIDQSMVDKAMERFLGEIEYNIDYKLMLWGHFHKYREYPRNIGVPCPENPRQIMLYNDCAIDVNEALTSENLVNPLYSHLT